MVYVEWAGPVSQSVIIPWTILDGPDAAPRLRGQARGHADLARAPDLDQRGTEVLARDLFALSGVKGVRRVIDVSGDGPNNSGPPVVPVRDEFVAGGIAINGLPIMLRPAVSSMFDLSDLDQYYASCVIGGAGAFMVPVRLLAEFASAIRRKLLLEISGLGLPAQIIRVQSSLPADGYDCMVGEKQWRWYQDRMPN